LRIPILSGAKPLRERHRYLVIAGGLHTFNVLKGNPPRDPFSPERLRNATTSAVVKQFGIMVSFSAMDAHIHSMV